MSDSDRRVIRSPVSPGEIVGGKYRVERILGAGGMGVVVQAVHEELGQRVALKFILQEALSGKATAERFAREARAVARLKSEHVARVFDVGRHGDDKPYMVLELLEGLDLAKLAKQRGPLPVADSVEYVLQSCEALIEAHGAGIVHRDLKPQNLFITKKVNGAPLVKVLDFGIAKAIGPAAAGQLVLTDSSAIIGSPLYMAPEQMRSARTADPRSDIWGLGVILYELLGGQLPFDGETVTEVCIHVVNDEPTPLDSLRPGLEPGLTAVVMRCLEKEPERRYQNVSQLAAALEPFSRSAKQGGPVRPWRSFEDTQDTGENRALAEATGPATPISMPEPDTAKTADDGSPLVRTDVTWGEGSSAPPHLAATHSRSRVAYASIAAGLVVVGALAYVVGRSAPVAAPSAASSPPPGVVGLPAAPSVVVTAAPAPGAPPVTSGPSVMSASSAPPAAPSMLPPAPAVVRGPARKGATPKPSAEPPPAPPPPDPKPPEAPPANGAPILR